MLVTAVKPFCPRSLSHCWTAATYPISASTGSMVTPPTSTFSNSAAGQHPALRGQHHRPGNIPLRLGRLIGRDQDLDVIARALAQSPVVTLVGPGGIGKTRLALAARSCPTSVGRRGLADRPDQHHLIERRTSGGGRRPATSRSTQGAP